MWQYYIGLDKHWYLRHMGILRWRSPWAAKEAEIQALVTKAINEVLKGV